MSPRVNKEGLFIDTDRSPFWYLTLYVDGRRRRISTEETDFVKASKRAHRIRQEIFRAEQNKPSRKLFVDELDIWIELRSKTWALGTTYDVKVKTKIAKEFFESSCLDEINEGTWEEFLGYMAQNLPERKIGKIQDYLASFLKFQFTAGNIKRIPYLRDPDIESSIGRVITDKELDRIFAECNNDKIKLQIMMQLFMGMRAGEVMKLHKSRVDLEARMIRLQASDTKTRTARVIPIDKDVWPLIVAQIKSSGSEWLFPSPINMDRSETATGNRTAFRNVLARANVKCRRHDLRHTCATRFARQGVQPMIACRILGMSLTVYDRIYCKPNEDDLRSAFKK